MLKLPLNPTRLHLLIDTITLRMKKTTKISPGFNKTNYQIGPICRNCDISIYIDGNIRIRENIVRKEFMPSVNMISPNQIHWRS